MNFRELNMILTQVLDELEAERKRGEKLDMMRKASRRQRWWEAPIDELGLCELEQLRMSMEEMKKNVMKLTSKLMADSSLPNGLPFSGVNNGLGLCDPFEDKDRDKSAEGEHFTSRRAVAESEEVAMLDDDDDAEELERQLEFVSWEVKLHPERWIGREDNCRVESYIYGVSRRPACLRRSFSSFRPPAIDAILATFFATHLKIPTLTCPLFGGSLAFEFFFELFFVAHVLDIFCDPLCARKRKERILKGVIREKQAERGKESGGRGGVFCSFSVET
ncbi:hypothetical protein NL676_039006 [Syzygium grande]|nr:hypothetical protein NL676_039006 [Syzygium grande]